MSWNVLEDQSHGFLSQPEPLNKQTIETIVIIADKLQWVPCNHIVTVRSPGGSLVLAVPLYTLPYAAFDLKSKPLLIHFLSILFCLWLCRRITILPKRTCSITTIATSLWILNVRLLVLEVPFLKKNYKLTKSQIISFGNKSFGCLKGPFTKPIYQAMKFCGVHKHVFHSVVKYDVSPIQLCIAMSGCLRPA